MGAPLKKVLAVVSLFALVATLSTPAQSAGAKYSVYQKTLATFSSSATTLTTQQKAQVKAAVEANPAAEKFICTGIRYFDQPFSVNITVRKRAKAACDYAKQLNPDLSTWFQNKPTRARSYAGKVLLTVKTSSSATSCTLAPEESGDLNLTIGTALPLTGNLAFLGNPMQAGVYLAINEIDEANAGIEISPEWGDSGDTSNRAYSTEIPRLLRAGSQVVIGSASSGVSLQFIDALVDACVVQISPANTSAAFTYYEDKGLYFRTAPSDVLQGKVLGDLIAEDGHQRISMIVLNDSYGTGLAEFTKAAFEAAGGEVIAEPTFNTGDTNFTAQIAEALAGDPDAIVLITFDEAKTIVPELTSQFPGDKLYFVDGNLTNYSADFIPGTLEGSKGTYPGVDETKISDFIEKMSRYWNAAGFPALQLSVYGAESYDATILAALAALEARSTNGANIAAKLREVSGGEGNGTKCFTFASCARIINLGGTADYEGPSGSVDFNAFGDPTDKASILIQTFGYDNIPYITG
jgi:branched-chain amino acid transport system substrate-binding protein